MIKKEKKLDVPKFIYDSSEPHEKRRWSRLYKRYQDKLALAQKIATDIEQLMVRQRELVDDAVVMHQELKSECTHHPDYIEEVGDGKFLCVFCKREITLARELRSDINDEESAKK